MSQGHVTLLLQFRMASSSDTKNTSYFYVYIIKIKMFSVYNRKSVTFMSCDL